MSEAGSENNDSPFECLTDQDTNGGSGHSHSRKQSVVVDSRATTAKEAPVAAKAAPTGTSDASTVAAAGDLEGQHPSLQESIINQLTPTSPLLPSASWVNGLLSRGAEKAKDSVDSVITTLDPGMREIIYSGGEINIAAIIDSQENGKQLISAIRDGFIDIFGRVTMKGIQVTATPEMTGTIVGSDVAEKMCEDRIASIRSNMNHDLPQNQVVVTMQSFLQKLSQSWYLLTAVYLHDPRDNSRFITHTQSIPIPCEAINWLECEKSSESTHQDSIYPKSLRDWHRAKYNIQPDNCNETTAESLEQSLTSITFEAMLRAASVALAKAYKSKLQSR